MAEHEPKNKQSTLYEEVVFFGVFFNKVIYAKINIERVNLRKMLFLGIMIG